MKSSARFKIMLQQAFVLSAALSAPVVSAADSTVMEVYLSPSCGCCKLWAEQMKKTGFNVKLNNVRDVTPYKAKLGVPEPMESCHTSVISRYVIEGHVPAADIKRLLREQPNAKGIAVPGMVQGSPGMEQGQGKERYDVVLFGGFRKYTVFAQH